MAPERSGQFAHHLLEVDGVTSLERLTDRDE